MIGWRARIGVILPADNAVWEVETNRLSLPGVSFHVARMLPLRLEDLPQEALRHIGSLKECHVDILVYACAASSFMSGVVANQELEERIKGVAKIDAITATSAMIRALKALHIQHVALATPYWRELDDQLLAYFREEGIQVKKIESLRLDSWEAMNRQTPAAVYGLARKADHPDAEGLLILSTNLPTLEVVPYLEGDLKKPVTSTNQAMIWAACRGLRIGDSLPGCGQLWRH